jgi:hypothetical protein
MGFAGSNVRFSGATRQFATKSARGGDAVRNSCQVCGSLVFGGEVSNDELFTVYAGSPEDQSAFQPTIAIFARSRPPWALIPLTSRSSTRCRLIGRRVQWSHDIDRHADPSGERHPR